MAIVDDLAEDPRWLRVPLDRQSVALRRHRALSEYKAGEQTMDRAQRAADQAEMSVSSLYKLVKKWDCEKGPDLWALVPYSGSTYEGIPRLPEETERVMRELIDAALADGIKGTIKITAAVKSRWPADGPKIPDPATIRSHVDSRGGFASVEKGSISLNTGQHAQETADAAETYGEVLVIDHTAADLFLDDSRGPIRATVTLAIDLHTASIAGRFVSRSGPSALHVLKALDDVQVRSRDVDGIPIMPRLLYAATNGEEWRELVDTIAMRGLRAKVRWGTRLHFGGPTRRMIGTSVADLKLRSRKKHDVSRQTDVFDPTKHALVTSEKADLVIDDAIARFNAYRLGGETRVPIMTGAVVKP